MQLCPVNNVLGMDGFSNVPPEPEIMVQIPDSPTPGLLAFRVAWVVPSVFVWFIPAFA